MKQIDLNKYKEFVQAVTSAESNNVGDMKTAVDNLEDSGVNVSLLLTGAVGIVQKVVSLWRL